MQTVGLKVLKNNLSAYIRAVTAGETVIVTDRDRVVAEIRPPGLLEGTTKTEQIIAELARQGIVTPAKHRLTGPPPKIGEGDFETLMREYEAHGADR